MSVERIMNFNERDMKILWRLNAVKFSRPLSYVNMECFSSVSRSECVCDAVRGNRGVYWQDFTQVQLTVLILCCQLKQPFVLMIMPLQYEEKCPIVLLGLCEISICLT